MQLENMGVRCLGVAPLMFDNEYRMPMFTVSKLQIKDYETVNEGKL